MSKSHLPALDGLRGLAAFWVLAGHVAQNSRLSGGVFWPLLNNGLAVDLFMMLSGFLMFYLHRQAEQSRPGEFILRRFFRLAPLYYFLLLVGFLTTPIFLKCAGVTWSYNGSQGWFIQNTPVGLLSHLSFLFGLSPTYQQSTPLPDWSLSLEAQFYVVFPFLMMLVRRSGVTITLVAVLLVSIILAQYIRQGWTFFFPSILPLRMNIFVAGMLLAKIILDGFSLPLAILSLVSVALPLSYRSADHEIVRCLMLIILFAGAGGSSTKLAVVLRNTLSNTYLRQAGELSYGVYLVHLMVMYPVFYLMIPIIDDKYYLFATVLLATTIVSYAASYVLNRSIEVPGMAVGRHVIRSLAARRDSTAQAATRTRL